MQPQERLWKRPKMDQEGGDTTPYHWTANLNEELHGMWVHVSSRKLSKRKNVLTLIGEGYILLFLAKATVATEKSMLTFRPPLPFFSTIFPWFPSCWSSTLNQVAGLSGVHNHSQSQLVDLRMQCIADPWPSFPSWPYASHVLALV